jgi:hypothetical protein
MQFKYMVLLTITALLLSACGNDKKDSGSVNDGQPSSESKALEHGITDQSEVGFEMTGGDIEEAQDVPQDDRKAILAAFDTYMTSFNEEDINTYMSVIAKEPEGFDYAEEETEVKKIFAEFDVNRTAEDVTLIKYDNNQAQVFATLNISTEQETTDVKLDGSGRQVTVFANEDGEWRITSVFFIGNPVE